MWDRNQLYCKILVVGEKSVGKSSLISLLIDADPQAQIKSISSGVTPYETYLSSPTYIPTRSPQRYIYTLNDALNIAFVELPSDIENLSTVKEYQREYSRVRASFQEWASEADFCILVYDTTRLFSWKECETKFFPYFQQDANKILLIGTKLDLEHEREVPLDLVEDFARKHGIFWMELTKFGQNVALTKSILSIRTGHWIESARNSRPTGNLFETLGESDFHVPLQSQNNPDSPLSREKMNNNNSHHRHQAIDRRNNYNKDSSHTPVISNKTRSTNNFNDSPQFDGNTSMGLQHIRALGNDIESYISRFSESSPSNLRAEQNHYLKENKRENIENESPQREYIENHISSLQDTSSYISPSRWKSDFSDDDDIKHVNEQLSFSPSPSRPMLDEFLSPHNQFIPQEKISIDIGEIKHPATLYPSKAVIQSFQESDNGNLVPVMEISLDSNDMGPKKSIQKKIYVDINIGDGRTGQLAIAPGDNVYHLSQLFVKAFNLNTAYVPYIAHLVRNTVAKYIEKQSQKPKPKHLTPVSEGGFVPFSFETEARAKIKKLKQPIVKMKFDMPGGKSGTIIVRKGDNPHALAKNFVHTYGLKESMIAHVAAKIQHQLYIYYSNQEESSANHDTPQKAPIPTPHHSNRKAPINRSTTKNADPTPLRTHSRQSRKGKVNISNSERVSHHNSIDSKVNQINVSLEERSKQNRNRMHSEAQSKFSNERLRSPSMQPSKLPPNEQRPKILFNMEVELKENEKHTFPVFENVLPYDVAQEFCKEHNLGPKHLRMLESLIQSNIDNFKRSR